ncbi:type I fatty acid synthase [Cryptosporidium ubiquitum]|uniref:Type I fatty acid synthase n=1 Tax=Cryptosporidium ubiquitum TaxID=857276 RepID=A0A1J4MKA0_9CRYT|nr:type I fatty acid synthase [Cryptosporidium ubiquitum]OII74447.1 type I fatty acid synthase [Cryptosporidium ubiquitum]
MAVNIKQHLEKVGMHGISNEMGIRVINDIMLYQNISSNKSSLGKYPVITCQSFNWNVYMRQLYCNSKYPSFFKEVVALMSTGEVKNSGMDFRGMSKEEVYSFVKDSVHNIVEQIIGIQSSSLDLDTPFSELGMDSLSAIELRNALISRFGIKISSTALFDYPTLRSIIQHLTDSLYVSETYDTFTDLEISISQREYSVAIIGVSCRLPGGVRSFNDLYEDILLKGKDCITEIPLDRWPFDVYYDPDPDNRSKSYVNQGAFTTDIDLFDNTFFGLSSTEATNVDPQQKYMLEVAYEAMYNCGITKRSLTNIKKTTKTGIEDPLLMGVFIGCCNTDWHFLQAKFGFENFTSYTGSGGASSLVSNRVSYSFGFRGPSQTIDTACSSSLVAMDAALKSLKEGSCHTALVGGVNLMLSPHLFVAFCRARMLSPDCRCKTFDAAANGYVRGEGCGAILLTKRLEVGGKKIRPIGYVLGSATNHNGRSASLTAPNGPSQTEVIQNALRNAKLTPNDIDYLESHGTGTPLGDPIEFGALKAVFGNKKDFKRNQPLILGALKTNIGHLEGAAGVSGLLKLILVLKNRIAPKILHFQKLNPHIDTENFDVEFPTELKAIVSNKPKLVGGVSSFGFGGCNSHVILESASDTELITENNQDKNYPYLIFAYTGQGCQYINMCKNLYDTEEVFRNEMDKCNKLLYPILGRSLISTIYCEQTLENEKLINHTSISQPAIFSIEYSLTKLWESKGIIPSAVMGHSLGEFAAAVTSGVLCLEDAIVLVARRAEIMASLPQNDGIMVACRVSEEQVLESIEKLNLKDSAAVAAINGPKSVTISGSRTSVMQILNQLGMEDRYKQLDVSHAFHSPLVSSAEEQFEKVIEKIQFSEPKITFISSVTGNIESKLLTEHKYWAQHILHSVRYYDALETAASTDEENIAIIEIGPKSILTSMGKQALGGIQLPQTSTEKISNNELIWIPTIDNSKSNILDFNAVYKVAQEYMNYISENVCIHKWNHSRFHWADLTSVHPLLGRFYSSISDENYLAYSTDMLKSKVFKNIVEDHIIFDTNIIPAAALIEASACAAFKLHKSEKFPSKYVELNSMDIEKPLVSNQDETTSEMEVFFAKSGSIQIRKKCISEAFEYEEEFSGPQIIANDVAFSNSRIYHHASISNSRILSKDEVDSHCIPNLEDYLKKYSSKDVMEIPIDNIYEMMNEIGLQYQTNYQCLKSVKIQIDNTTDDKNKNAESTQLNEVLCYVKRPASDFDLTELRIHPGMLDSVFQAASVLFASEELLKGKDVTNNKRGHVAMAPIGFTKCLYGRIQHNSDVWGLVKLNRFEKTGSIAFIDVTLWDSKTNILAAHFQDLILKGFSNAASLLSQEVRIPNQLLWKTYHKKIADNPNFVETNNTSELGNGNDQVKEVNIEDTDQGGLIQKILIFGIPTTIKELICDTISKKYQNMSTKFICLEEDLTIDLIDQSIQEEGFSAIFYLGGLADSLSTKQVMGDILKISQVISTIAVSIKTPPFICLTSFNDCEENPNIPRHSGIRGFVKTARVELENVIGKSINISHVDCKSSLVNDPEALMKTISLITSSYDGNIKEEIALERDLKISDDGIYAPRLESINFPVFGAVKLSMSSRGAIGNLKFKPQPQSERVNPPANTVEIRVKSIGLNFRDVLNVMGLYPGDPGPPGGDCSGIVVAVGEGVKHIQVGDNVFGIAPGCLKTYVTTDSNLYCKH